MACRPPSRTTAPGTRPPSRADRARRGRRAAHATGRRCARGRGRCDASPSCCPSGPSAGCSDRPRPAARPGCPGDRLDAQAPPTPSTSTATGSAEQMRRRRRPPRLDHHRRRPRLPQPGQVASGRGLRRRHRPRRAPRGGDPARRRRRPPPRPVRLLRGTSTGSAWSPASSARVRLVRSAGQSTSEHAPSSTGTSCPTRSAAGGVIALSW